MTCFFARIFPVNGTDGVGGVFSDLQAPVLFATSTVSFMGAISNLAFICRKKTNFLARRIIYMSVATTILLETYWVLTMAPYIDAIPSVRFDYCEMSNLIYNGTTLSTLWIATILTCSIYFTILSKLCGCDCFYRRATPSQTKLTLKYACLELLFIAVSLGVSVAIGVTSILVDTTQDTMKFTYIILPAVPVLISIIGNVALVIWFCRRRQFARRREVLKESGILFLLFLSVFLIWTLEILSVYNESIRQAYPSVLISPFLSLFPYCVLVYNRYSFRTKPRHVSFVNVNTNTSLESLTATAPPSNRVSLSPDTAEHAPNFLSPSTAEPTEETALVR